MTDRAVGNHAEIRDCGLHGEASRRGTDVKVKAAQDLRRTGRHRESSIVHHDHEIEASTVGLRGKINGASYADAINGVGPYPRRQRAGGGDVNSKKCNKRKS